MDAVAALPPLGAQLYVYEPVPPVALAVAVPVLPEQEEGVDVALALIADGCVMVVTCVVVQLFASVTVTV